MATERYRVVDLRTLVISHACERDDTAVSLLSICTYLCLVGTLQ